MTRTSIQPISAKLRPHSQAPPPADSPERCKGRLLRCRDPPWASPPSGRPTPPLQQTEPPRVRGLTPEPHLSIKPRPPGPEHTWTPAEDKDQRVQDHPPVQQVEGGPLLVAQVTAGGHNPPVDPPCLHHQNLQQDR